MRKIVLICGMKDFAGIFLIVALVAGCSLQDPVSAVKKGRYETMPGPGGDGGKKEQEQEQTPYASTSLYYAAVIVPDGYDWQRDSAAGAQGTRICLYKDFKLIKNISCGPESQISSDPDSHHLLGGNLYTEFTRGNHTFIKCNGEALWDYEGREFLKGILLEGDDIWTLSQNRSGQGFTLRKNGKSVIQNSTGVIIGDLSTAPRGALYIDGGEICFCYKVEADEGHMLYSVRAGKEKFEKTISGNALDFVQSGGKNYALYLPAGLRRGMIMIDGKFYRISNTREDLVNANLVSVGDKIYLAGTFDREFFYGEPNKLKTIPMKKGGTIYAYPEDNGIATVIADENEVRVESSGASEILSGDYHFFSHSCACFTGGSGCIALTPRESGAKKLIWRDSDCRELDFNGFISCVELFTTR